MANDDNVIPFPKRNSTLAADFPQTEEDLDNSIERLKELFFDTASVELSAPVFNRAALYGFNIQDDEYILDCILVVEAIKSLLQKTKGIHHPLQEYAKSSIKYDDSFLVDDDEVFDFDE